MNEKKKKFGNKKEIAIVNSVTALRFVGSFLVIPIFKAMGGISAAVFSAIFLLTDFIDGFLARKLKASTFFGALFDGATDKAYGIMAFLLLMTINPVLFSIPLLIEVGIILVQNKKLHNGQSIKSNMIGKVKTWFLSLSIVGSFIGIDLLNLPPFLDYIKYASLNKVASIKETLILLGIELPTIVAQFLTLRSYAKEAKAVSEEIKLDNSALEKAPETIPEVIEQPKLETPNVSLQEINIQKEMFLDEKRQILKKQKSLLEKIKILSNAMFDPEYYEKNKDMPIRKLTRELFDSKK